MIERLASKLRTRVLPDRPTKEIFLCTPDSLEQFARDIKVASQHFGLLLLMDARGQTDETLFDAAKQLVSKGLVYLCAWGADCERVHDRFDDAEGPRGRRSRSDRGQLHVQEYLAFERVTV